jgi:hypothetical protein
MLTLLEGRARHHKRLPLLVSNIFGALSKHCNVRSLTLLTTSVDFVKVGRHRISSLVTDSDDYIMLPTSARDTEDFSKPLHLTLLSEDIEVTEELVRLRTEELVSHCSSGSAAPNLQSHLLEVVIPSPHLNNIHVLCRTSVHQAGV